jgi:NAD(P)-dependent dehydrogenase (short-subunit alcohol dehydrogenase family)
MRDGSHGAGSSRHRCQPLGSRMGTVDDVADAVEFFTGKLSRWISGAQLLVSGGAS